MYLHHICIFHFCLLPLSIQEFKETMFYKIKKKYLQFLQLYKKTNQIIKTMSF